MLLGLFVVFFSGSVMRKNVIKSHSSSSPSLCYFMNLLGHIARIGNILRGSHLKCCLLKVINILLSCPSLNCWCSGGGQAWEPWLKSRSWAKERGAPQKIVSAELCRGSSMWASSSSFFPSSSDQPAGLELPARILEGRGCTQGPGKLLMRSVCHPVPCLQIPGKCLIFSTARQILRFFYQISGSEDFWSQDCFFGISIAQNWRYLTR